MNKLDKKTIKELSDLAKSLPKVFTEIPVLRVVNGQQLINAGHYEIDDKEKMAETVWENGKPVLVQPKIKIAPKKNYIGSQTYKKPVNHLKMLKKAYLNGGVDAVLKYAKEMEDLFIQNMVPQQIGGIATKQY